jgi:poly-gamma-glutamate capsule biosynthesis protein CapA/YwtB (metallophosphatase superfamily)
MKKAGLAVAVLVVAVVIAWRWNDARVAGPALPPLPPRGGGPLTVVATGDAVIVNPLTSNEARTVSALVPLLGGADVALTNLEVNLLERERLSPAGSGVRWPYGTAEGGETLRRLGVNAVSLANNHTGDYGAEGIRDTRRILDQLGLQHAGSGDGLEQARAPAFVGRSPRRVAMFSVTTSSAAESRATSARGDIQGRPGLNPLRYTADVTADPITFETLKGSTAALKAGPQPSDQNAVNLFGTTIKKGPRTVVEFVIDAGDLQQILDRIRTARGDADAVIVSLHSHEPSNASDAPAEFVRRFARAAIDAGAALVVGHGPHRIRGVEVYGQGAILYSVGNFIFQVQGLDRRAADVYDAGVDLYRMAMGAVDFSEPRVLPTFEEPVWWEGVIARATFDRGALTSLQLQPIDLGAGLPKEERGIPRLAEPARARDIVDRLSQLSAQLGTRVSSTDGLAIVDLSGDR